MKVKCFPFQRHQNLRLIAIQFVACCSSAAEKSNVFFFHKKMVIAHKTHAVSRKILTMKGKDKKCYMYLKFHINPPYIV